MLRAFCQGAKAGDEAERFRREYPVAGKALRARLARAKGTCVLTRKPASGAARVAKGAFNIDGEARKVVINRVAASKQTATELVFRARGKTGFALARPAKKGEFLGLGIGDMAVSGYESNFGRLFSASHALMSVPIADLMRSPSRRITSAREVDERGRKNVELAVKYVMEGPVVSKMSARIVFDPNAGWIVRRGSFHPAEVPDAEFDYVVEYDEKCGSPPLRQFIRFKAPGSTVE